MLQQRPSSPQRTEFMPPLSAIGGDAEDGAPSPRGSFDIERPTSERSSLLPATPIDEPVDWVMACLLFLFPAVGGLLFGYDIGATSGALLSMTSPELSGTEWYSLSAFQSGLVVSLSLGGALLGSAAALVYGDRLGRRKELLLAAGLYGAYFCVPALGGAVGAAGGSQKEALFIHSLITTMHSHPTFAQVRVLLSCPWHPPCPPSCWAAPCTAWA